MEFIKTKPFALKRLQKIVSKVTLYVLDDIKGYAEFKKLSTAEKENWIKNEISRIESHVVFNLTKKQIKEIK